MAGLQRMGNGRNGGVNPRDDGTSRGYQRNWIWGEKDRMMGDADATRDKKEGGGESSNVSG